MKKTIQKLIDTVIINEGLYETNSSFVRSKITNLLRREFCMKYPDTAFKIKCEESNNPPEVIERNCINLDVMFKNLKGEWIHVKNSVGRRPW